MRKNHLMWTALMSATLVLLGGWSVSAQTAEDEPGARRKGFIVGIGGGGALHRAPEGAVAGDVPGLLTSTRPAASSFAVATDFRIGYAPTDQFLIYYSNKAAFTQAISYDAVGISGFGVTYMTRPTSPSFFVNGIAGQGARAELRSRDFGVGHGFGVGGGYEFSRHWSISGDALFIRLGNNDNHTVVLATFNYLYY